MLNPTMFGNTGFSSAKATHFANVAKELAENMQAELSNVSLVNSTITMGDQKLEFQQSNFNLSKVAENIGGSTSLMRLNAWFRESVRQKESAIQEKQEQPFQYDKAGPVRPTPIPYVNEDWGIQQLSVKELNDYYGLEAEAAALGKLIHNRGVVSSWRKKVSNFQPFHWEKEYPVTSSLGVNKDQVEQLFFGLQQKHRELNSKLNYYKAKITNLVNEKNKEITAENAKAMRAYTVEYDKFEQGREAAQSDFDQKRLAELRELAELKIVIPNELQETVDLVKEYAEGKSDKTA